MKSLQWPKTREIARLKYSRMPPCVCCAQIMRNDAPRIGNKLSWSRGVMRKRGREREEGQGEKLYENIEF